MQETAPPARPLRFTRHHLAVLLVLGVGGCATSPVPPPAAAPAPRPAPAPAAPRDVGAMLAPIVARAKIPGMAAVVLRGDQIIAAGVTGVRKRGDATPLTLDDQFLLCSATKAMTATLAAQAVEEGRFAWASTLGEILPDAPLHPDWKPATLAQLLDHRAGAPADTANLWGSLRLQFSDAPAAEKGRTFVTRTLTRPPNYPPGSRYVYTGVDYLIIGAMLQQVTGRAWEDLVREKLWEPLGITSGGFGAPGTPGRVDQPWGHWGATFTGQPVAPGGFWARLNPPAFYGPAATAQMTIADWARFVALHLRGDPANPHQAARLLTAESFAVLHQAAPGKSYASGWILTNRPWAHGHRPGDTGRVLISEGDNGFWHADAWVAPEIDLAVLIIINQGNASGPTPAGLGVHDACQALIDEFAPKSGLK